MKTFKNRIIIGIDHGYGNIKTVNCCFKTGILSSDTEPLFTSEMLTYEGRYYLIGEGHKSFIAEKDKDDEFYILTLAAIAKELRLANITYADIHIAAGLPLTWTGAQKESFAGYLTRNKEASFRYRNTDYSIRITGASIYPQGYAAISRYASALKGINLIADIGNGTMNVLYIVDGKPISGKMFTEKYGTYQCTLQIREAFLRKTGREISDYTIDEILINGTSESVSAHDLEFIREIATEYVRGIFTRLSDHGYDPNTMKLRVTGGGSCLIRNFATYDSDRTVIVDDICAAAKGYEYMAELQLTRGHVV